MKNHIMLDLETLGVRPGSIILSIGAVRFDENGIEDSFIHIIDPENSVKYGLTMDVSTVRWWINQSDAAKKEISTLNACPLKTVLKAFSEWLNPDDKIWGNGANFDNVLLRCAFNAVDLRAPWPFWNDRCFRTVKELFPQVEKGIFEGTKHSAINDAIHQAHHLIKICKETQLKLA